MSSRWRRSSYRHNNQVRGKIKKGALAELKEQRGTDAAKQQQTTLSTMQRKDALISCSASLLTWLLDFWVFWLITESVSSAANTKVTAEPRNSER